jgi:hypothetical protein
MASSVEIHAVFLGEDSKLNAGIFGVFGRYSAFNISICRKMKLTIFNRPDTG